MDGVVIVWHLILAIRMLVMIFWSSPDGYLISPQEKVPNWEDL